MENDKITEGLDVAERLALELYLAKTEKERFRAHKYLQQNLNALRVGVIERTQHDNT